MIAYNNLCLNNNLAVSELEAALAANLITKNEFEASVPLYSVKFYSPHLFVRMGLFILTTVVVIFSLGLFSLLFLSALNQDGAGTLFIFFGLICYALLEWSDADIFVCIGTSLQVYPTAGLIDFVQPFTPKYIIDKNIPAVGNYKNMVTIKKPATEGGKELINLLAANK